MERPTVYSMFRIELVNRLAELYKTDYVAVAKVCDEALDRSGALLGEVRTRHSELRSQQKQHTAHNNGSTPLPNCPKCESVFTELWCRDCGEHYDIN